METSVSDAGIAVRHQRDSLRDTVESIVVALILAFVFRAFIVEAFVIPTGSMAPTLYGAHGTILCADCGWEFTYGLQDPSEGPRSDRVEASATVVCPNCNHRQSDLHYNDSALNAESGDRILVLKWPYDLGGTYFGPHRWDVTVFKNPSDGSQNYIKRLAGLPNEVLMIVDGDVYSASLSRLAPSALKELDELRHMKYLLQSGQTTGRMPSPSAALLSELDQKLTIARKSESAQEALWFIVYDHDYPPRSLDQDQPRWQAPANPAPKWSSEGRVLTFYGNGENTDFVELMNKPVVASYAYNVMPSRLRPGQLPAVTDQRIRFVITPETPDASFAVKLVKHGRSFWAVVRSDGGVSLSESRDVPTAATPILAQTQLAPLQTGRPKSVSFELVDYRLSLHVDGSEVLASSSDPDSPAYYGPNLKAIRALGFIPSVAPRIYGRTGKFEIRHLVVERDVYYYDMPLQSAPWAGTPGWGTAESPIMLRDGEYFMLGDNSPASQDSRLWGDISRNEFLSTRGEDYQLGTVPADQLIGRAFFVYWPSGHRIPWLPVPARWQGIIPDVGRMRWIR